MIDVIPADDAVTDGAEIAADAQPGLQGDAEIAFESAFREVSGGADQVIEAGEKGVTVNIRRLRESRETQENRKAAKQPASNEFHMAPLEVQE